MNLPSTVASKTSRVGITKATLRAIPGSLDQTINVASIKASPRAVDETIEIPNVESILVDVDPPMVRVVVIRDRVVTGMDGALVEMSISRAVTTLATTTTIVVKVLVAAAVMVVEMNVIVVKIATTGPGEQ